MARRTADKPSSRHRGVATALVVLCVAPIVLRFGQGGQAATVSLAAAFAGLAGTMAGVALFAGVRPVHHASRVARAWWAFLAAALVSMLVSGRMWSALVGENTNMLGWATLVAASAVAGVASLHLEDVRRLLVGYGHWVLLGESALVFGRLTGMVDVAGSGTLPNSTYLGEAILLLLPWALPHTWRGTRAQEWTRGAVAVVAVSAMAAAGARVAALVGVAWLVWTLVRRTSGPVRVRIAGGVALVGVVLGAGLLFAGQEIATIVDPASLGQRPEMWRLAWLATLQRPLLGWGADGFMVGAAKVSTPALAASGLTFTLAPGYVDPHGLPLWIAVSTGVIGLAAFVFFAVETVRTWRHPGGATGDVAAGVWAVVGTTVVLLTAPAAVQILPLFALVFGVSVGHEPPRTGKTTPRSRRWVWRITAAVTTVVSLVLTLNAFTRWAAEPRATPVTPVRAAMVQTASDIWLPDAHMAYLASLHWTYAGVPSERSLIAIKRAMQWEPRNPFYAHEKARLLWFTGAPSSDVDAAFLESFAGYPAFPLAHAEYALYLAEAGRTEEARMNLSVARLANDQDQERIAAIDGAEQVIASGER